VLGIDFILNGGLFAGLYSEPIDFLLPPEEAFRLIPLGYLSILLQVILVLWLMVSIKLDYWLEGAAFGGKIRPSAREFDVSGFAFNLNCDLAIFAGIDVYADC